MGFKLGNQVVEFLHENDDIELVLPQSAIRQNSDDVLLMIRQPYAFFAEQVFTKVHDNYHFKYRLDEGTKLFSNVQQWRLIDKLQLAQKLLVVQELENSVYATTLHPENIMISSTEDPIILYRGIRAVMPPVDFDDQLLFSQLKSLLIILINGKGQFDDLAEGGYKFASGSKLIKKIISANDYDDLNHILAEQLITLKADEDSKKRVVSKIRYRVYQQATIWMTVATLILLAVVGYWQFSLQPREDSFSSATTGFLKKNYSDVTKELTDVSESALPMTQRYELAYSYVQSAALSNKQREAVLNNISLNSNKNYLNFWIEIGRGQLGEALDTAKTTEDNDLILYAITEKMAKIKADPNKSGASREKSLNDLQKSYDKYYKLRKKALNDK
ncbi:type VII secretion protein EssB [Latilactobacillus graminis]|uniref:Type VII secretion protein EssB n=2 Tax=Latilactobacillus graminis TaxID=60519 RepID=A0AA89I278_9LACO|nr:type VII secretion protein EssB [Latilactobacillus graminis]KRM22338.1 hypothetical protein FC90_GL000939 [Latilactobacillus graminis DSM 20719]QFP79488.1 type VII secretion protein EssB [Latilactobacillus graminis]